MKTISKKSLWLTTITILCFIVVTLFAVYGCGKTETPTENYTNGIIINYSNCWNLVGLYIVTEKNDSLLSFNVPLSVINIDKNSLKPGSHAIGRVSIRFAYRIAVGEEIKQIIDFICPQNTFEPGTFQGEYEDYTQIIVTDIKLNMP